MTLVEKADGCHDSAICSRNLLKPASRLTSDKVRGVKSGRFVSTYPDYSSSWWRRDAERHRGLGAGEGRGAGG